MMRFQNLPRTTESPLVRARGLIHIESVKALPAMSVEAEFAMLM